MSIGPAPFGTNFLVWQQNHWALTRRTLQAVLEGRAASVPKEDVAELLNGWAIGKKLLEKRTGKEFVGVGLRDFDREFDQLTNLLQACGIDLERFYMMLSAPQIVESRGENKGHSAAWTLGVRAYWLHLLILILLGMAFVDWNEYGFYVLLRFFCCATFVRWGWIAMERKHKIWTSTWVLLALLYNPFFPLILGRFVWELVNGVTFVFVVMNAIALWKRPQHEEEAIIDQDGTKRRS